MSKKDNENTKEISIYGVVDERTKVVVNQGDAYTARFMLFALLIDIILRGMNVAVPFTDSNWDLMLIVIAGGFISTVYQIQKKILFNRPLSRSVLLIAALMIICAVIAFLTLLLFKQ